MHNTTTPATRRPESTRLADQEPSQGTLHRPPPQREAGPELPRGIRLRNCRPTSPGERESKIAKRILAVMLAAAMLSACVGSTGEQTLEEELEAFEDQLLAHEEMIAECMTAQGFQYEVGLPADWYLEKASTLDEAAGGTGIVDVEIPEEVNNAYASSLDAEELAAFKFAYWGDIEDGGTQRGCYAKTYEAVWGIDPFAPSPDALQSALDLRAAVERHPDVVAALDRYLACMSDAGYDVVDIDHIHEIVGIAELENPDDDSIRIAAYSAHDDCRADYHSIYDRVHLDLAANPPPGK